MVARRSLFLLLSLLGLSQPALGAERVMYVHTDVAGSPVAWTDSTGVVIRREFYSPYGEPTIGAVRDGPGYAGHATDSASGLSYMQQRYYDPELGVFLSADPVSALVDPWRDFCRYCYARNNPFLFTDPDGRQVMKITTSIPEKEMTRADRETMRAFNRAQLAYERAVTASGDKEAMSRYLNTPFEYRKSLSPQAQAIQSASGQSDAGIKAYREPGKGAVTILPGFLELTDSGKTFPSYHGMELGRGGDTATAKVVFHEHGHVEDKDNNTPHDREAKASEYSNRMMEYAPRNIRTGPRGRR